MKIIKLELPFFNHKKAVRYVQWYLEGKGFQYKLLDLGGWVFRTYTLIVYGMSEWDYALLDNNLRKMGYIE